MTVNGELPVYTADEVLLGKQDASDQIVIIGGGLVGCETALWLAQQGKKVSVVESSSGKNRDRLYRLQRK